MRGGLIFYRGIGSAARAYLESDHSHADDYYLEQGAAVAEWTALDSNGQVFDRSSLDGDAYQAWVDWQDPLTLAKRGNPRDEVRLSKDGEVVVRPSSPRFVEMTVNCDKSLSVAAAMFPEVSAALDAAQAQAVEAMGGYMAQNSVTRVGARGAQRFVPVERLEQVAVVHRTSRAGDPHRHVHVQWNTRVYAEGQWRGLHTAATLRQQAALRGVGEAAINSNAELRDALARVGLTFDAATGKVTNLEEHARVLSKRADQINRHAARFEAEWRAAHPGQEPDRALRLRWDQQAWALDRPQKANANMASETVWLQEMKDAGLQVDGFAPTAPAERVTVGSLTADELTAEVLTAAEARSSAWSIADLEGHVGLAVAARNIESDAESINTFVRDAAQQIARQLPTLEVEISGEIPQWVRNITSDRVLHVERTLRDRFTTRGMQSGLVFPGETIGTLNQQQSDAARAIASRAPLVVIEGAAGSGKTTMLGAARELAATDDYRLLIVAPTLRAAAEAASSTGAAASSAHKLAHEYGFRWTDAGAWSRLAIGEADPATGTIYEGPSAEFAVDQDTRIVIDEAGMIDQDLAYAVTTIADETGAGVGLIGDRAQLPAVGRGGVLDMAVAAHPRPLDMSEVHRFRQPEYAAISLRMRDRVDPGDTFDQLAAAGHIVLHGSDQEVVAAIGADVVAKAEAGATIAVAVPSNEAATEINAIVQDARARAGHTRTPRTEIAGMDGLSIRPGDKLMTRRNDRDLGVANRDVWDVARVHPDASVTVKNGATSVRLPAEYVQEHTHLAYATTEYGVQGATVDYAHGVVTESSSAQALYVAATRGREDNSLHIVAADMDEARGVFVDAMGRQSGDRGVEAAREAIRRDLDGIVLPQGGADENVQLPAEEANVATSDEPQGRSITEERIAAEERLFAVQLREYEATRAAWERRHPGENPDDYRQAVRAAEKAAAAATSAREDAERAAERAAVDAGESTWRRDYDQVQQAATAAEEAGPFRRRAAQQDHDAAVRSFTDRHQAAPTPTPPRELVDGWARSATRPGANETVDRARRREEETRDRAAALKADPAPTNAPTRPTRGTPEQEAAKDAAYVRRQNAAQRQQGARVAPAALGSRQRGPRL